MAKDVGDQIVVNTRRLRVMWFTLWAGVILAFLYAALSVVLIHGLIGRQNELCVSRQASRSAIRQTFERDPDWSNADQIWLDSHYPAVISC